jgi:hypothetical protein
MNPVRSIHQLLLGIAFLAGAMQLGCAFPSTMQTSNVSVWARSHNRSTMDVYLLCGDRNARWLGTVLPNDAVALDFPKAQARCVQGLNFFLVARDYNRGYWVGPTYPQAGSQIDLVIEKYAGLSSLNLRRE